MPWYYLTRNPWREADALPSVNTLGAKLHYNPVREPISGELVYGWIETAEELKPEMIKEYGLVPGNIIHE